MGLRDRLFGDHDDDLDGCDLDFKSAAINPDDLPYYVLFGGDIPQEEADKKAAEYKELFSGT